MENQPKPLKTYKNRHGTMKNQSGTIKTNLELDRVLWGVQVVTGDSQEEVMIFRDTHTDKHCIIIYISSSSLSLDSVNHSELSMRSTSNNADNQPVSMPCMLVYYNSR